MTHAIHSFTYIVQWKNSLWMFCSKIQMNCWAKTFIISLLNLDTRLEIRNLWLHVNVHICMLWLHLFFCIYYFLFKQRIFSVNGKWSALQINNINVDQNKNLFDEWLQRCIGMIGVGTYNNYVGIVKRIQSVLQLNLGL